MFRKSSNSIQKIISIVVSFLRVLSIVFLIFIFSLGGIALNHFITNDNSIKNINAEKIILVDATEFLLGGGIYTLTKNIVQEISKKRPKWKFIIAYPKDTDDKWWRSIMNEHIIPLHIKKSVPTLACFYYAFDIFEFCSGLINKLPKSMRNIIGKMKFFLMYSQWLPDIDLLFDPATTTCINNFYFDRITIIHDLLYHYIPNLTPHYEFSKKATEAAIKNSNEIITISKFSRDRIIDRFDCKNINMIYTRLPKRLDREISYSESTLVLNKYNLKKFEYIVYPSAFWKHKNHERLILAFKKFIKTYNDQKLKLVLLGIAPAYSRIYKLIPSHLKDRIVVTDFVDDTSFQIILQNAKAVIQCSLHEGFGMTVFEGMAAGRPVAAGDVTSIPEIAGDAVLYFDPYSVDDICRAIFEITTDIELQNLLIAKGKIQVTKFSNTDQMIDEYIKVFESVMKINEEL